MLFKWKDDFAAVFQEKKPKTNKRKQQHRITKEQGQRHLTQIEIF